MATPRERLTDEERSVYEWQLWLPELGERGQERLKGASVLVSRIGGVGGAAAYWLAAAGVGRLVLAHEGDVRPSDLNRQILMTHEGIGKPRAESAARRLRELNPRLEVEPVNENVTEANAARLVGEADVVVDGAPLFRERFAMNREAVRQGKPLVECAMYGLEAQVTTIVPGRTPCLACLYPAEPPGWNRRFPVLGAAAGLAGTLGAVEAVKVLCGIGEPLLGRMLLCDLREMSFRTARLSRDPSCPVCAGAKG